MEVEQLLIVLAIGAIAGWLAGKFFRGGGFGLIGNIVVGLLGAFLGDWLFRQLGVSIGGQWVGPIAKATVGAIVLLFVVSLIKKR